MPDTTKVVNLRSDPYDVYVGRAGQGHNGYFGNPFRAGQRCSNCGEVHATGEATLPCFHEYFLQRIHADATFRHRVLKLRGKTLGCFCKPGRCHGDIIASWIDSQPLEDTK